MPSKKKKYNARFPSGRIKKIMQTDEEVGKVAQAVPVIISRTLELFVKSLLTKAMEITSARNAKTLTPSHMKQCILSESRFDFLKDLVKTLPDAMSAETEEGIPLVNFSLQPSKSCNASPEGRRHTDRSLRTSARQSSETQSRPESYGNGVNPNFYTENLQVFSTPPSSTVVANDNSNCESSNDDDENEKEEGLEETPNVVPTTFTQQPTSSADLDEDYDT